MDIFIPLTVVIYAEKQPHCRLQSKITGCGIAQKKNIPHLEVSSTLMPTSQAVYILILHHRTKPRFPTHNIAQATWDLSCLPFLWVHDFFIWPISSLSAIGRMECDPIPA